LAEETPGFLDSVRAAGDVWGSEISGAVGRVFKWVLTIGLAGAVGAAWLGGWRYSDDILEGTLRPQVLTQSLLDDGTIVEIGDAAISLRPAEGVLSVARDGVFGLAFPGGTGIAGPLINSGQVVARQWTPVEGVAAEGMQFALVRNTYQRDPLQDHGIRFLDVQIPSPGIGQLPAWYVPGVRPTWVIITHDLGSDLTESLRTLPLYTARGFPVLVISYRNDPGTFQEEDPRVGHGLTEWHDLQAAVEWARDTGAREFILAGTGTGASISLEFMSSSPFAPEVAALVLDAPTLDLGAVIDADPAGEAIPQILRSLGKTIATFRFGVNWSELDYVTKFSDVSVPTLLIHGSDDEVVPVALSDELAERYAGRVEYLRVEGAGHGESWNVASAGYESAIQQFLTRIIATGLDADEALATDPPVSEPSPADDGES
jgi:fermentation-respiration switch protein FrsA (DUF1100 family)